MENIGEEELLEPRNFKLVEEIKKEEIINLSTKRRINYIGLKEKSNDPIFDEYEDYLRGCPTHGVRSMDRGAVITQEDKFSVNLMRKMYFCLGDKKYEDPKKFVKRTEKNIVELFSALGYVTNTGTIKNYLRAFNEFINFLINFKLSITGKEDIQSAAALRLYQEKLHQHTKKIFNHNMNIRRQKPDTIIAHPYPYFLNIIETTQSQSTRKSNTRNIWTLLIQDGFVHNSNEWWKTGDAVQDMQE